jgi:hypothetical protein
MFARLMIKISVKSVCQRHFFPSFSKAREMGGNTIKNQGGQEGEEDYIMSAIKFNQRT